MLRKRNTTLPPTGSLSSAPSLAALRAKGAFGAGSAPDAGVREARTARRLLQRFRSPCDQEAALPEGADLSEFGWSPNGERIVFMASIGGEPDFWLISDFLPEGR